MKARSSSLHSKMLNVIEREIGKIERKQAGKVQTRIVSTHFTN